jgi:hypothetical protein
MRFELVDFPDRIDNHTMKTLQRALLFTFSVCLLGSYALGSTIMVGEPRPPTNPANVRVYMEPPRRFERIAIIRKGSGGTWAFSDQGQVDEAIAKIRVEAAKVGANGILLQVIETNSSGGIGIGIGGIGFPSRHVAIGGSTGFYAPIMHKTVQAEAIWVRH